MNDELDNDIERSSMWAITYGDLMSFMAVFFMMAAASLTTQAKAPALAAKEEMSAEAERLGRLFANAGIQQIARVDLGESRMRVVLLEPVLFDSGGAALKSPALPQLRKVAEALKMTPNQLQVEGHTDDRPIPRLRRGLVSYRSNWELSTARAFAVMNFLIEEGISPARLSAIGYGEFRPIGPNDTPEGRARNRRIEINLIRPKS